MSFIIPQHTLVLIQDGETTPQVRDLFPEHEIVTVAAVQRDLIGDGHRPEMARIIEQELRRRIILKLSLGERAIVPTDGLTMNAQVGLAREAHAQGASLLALVSGLGTSLGWFASDFGAAVLSVEQLPVQVSVRPPDAILPHLREHFQGITVLGDVHGDMSALNRAHAWAKSRNHYLWLLGDMLDYGEESLATIEMIYDLVMTGQASVILGNHERKIARWIQAHEDGETRSVRLSEGNKATTRLLNGLSTFDRQRWVGRFRTVLGRSSLISHLRHVTLAHAGVHPGLWNSSASDDDVEHFALFGESRYHPDKRDYTLSYGWVDQVPAGNLVIVGHDTRSKVCPVVVDGKKGGSVVFLDTGSGKGGALSSADLRFGRSGSLTLENFNRH